MSTPPITLHRVRCECGAIYVAQTTSGMLICDSCDRKVKWGGFEDPQPLNQVVPSSVPNIAPLAKTPPNFGWILKLYKVGYGLFFVVIFLGCWIYSIVASGFIIGVLIGWLPSAIVAAIASFFWPLLLLAIIAIAVYFKH